MGKKEIRRELQSLNGGKIIMAYNPRVTRNEMNVRPADVRNKDFEEVATGYTKVQAIDEATRCLNCKVPQCQKGCPVGINIPAFLKKVGEDDIDGAYSVISESSCLPAICGRVCPQEKQCEAQCLRGKMVDPKTKAKGESVAIGRVERYVADNHNKIKEKVAKSNGHKVAVVGSGPSGLACAYDLSLLGYKVTIFEALHRAGGVLIYGIPEFRLPKRIVAEEIELLKSRGVEVRCDVVIGRTITLQQLEKEYDAIFLGTGAGLPKFLNIPGEDSMGVFSANELLTRVNLMHAHEGESKTPFIKPKKAVVIGGGNVAMDALRVLKRVGAEVTCVYRRSMEELPARKEEVEHAKEEGIIFDLLRNPIEIISDRTGSMSLRASDFNPNYGRVTGIKVQKQKLGQPDSSGRRSPVPVSIEEDKDAIYTIECDCVVEALGTSPNPIISSSSGISVNNHGCFIVDENEMTSIGGVFSGGDAVTGAATVISAMGAGKKAAAGIDKYIKEKK